MIVGASFGVSWDSNSVQFGAEVCRVAIRGTPRQKRGNFKTLVDHYRLKELVVHNHELKAYSTKKAYES
jgi:hypothetical protein